jgi:hypothetical protein
MKYLIWILLFVFMPFTAVMAQQTVQVNLAGYKNVPPVHSPGSGVINVTLQSDTLFVEGKFEDLRSSYRSSSIHYGSEREAGNRLFGLKVQLNEDRRGGEIRKEENYFVLRPSLKQALANGNLYISIATERHQRGEIRGQIPALE